MNEKNQRKYEELKKKQQEHMKIKKWQSNSLFMECIQKIDKIDIIPETQCELLLNRVEDIIPITLAGHVDWNKMKHERETISYRQIENYLETHENYYVIWNNCDLPIIKCDLQSIIEHFVDFETVDFSYLAISEDLNVILEAVKFGYVNMGIL